MNRNRANININQGVGLTGLSLDQMNGIHTAVCYLLHEVGIFIEYEEAADLFAGAGAKVNKVSGGWLAKIPEWVLTEALATVPKAVTYHGRSAKNDYSLEGKRTTFATFGEQVKINDIITRENRTSIKDDCEMIYRLVDALPGLNHCQRALCPGDKMPGAQAAHNFHAAMRNCSKHISIGMVNKDNVEAMRQMAIAIAGSEEAHLDRPIATCSSCSVSPLALGCQGAESMIYAARAGFNVDIMVMVLAGGTSPATLGSSVVQTLAEHMAGVILSQLARKGVPVTLGSCSTVLDMRNGMCTVGAPEWSLVGSAIAQMGRYYGIPTRIGGGVSDSKMPDQQAAYEFALNSLTLAYAGANIIFGMGGLEAGLTIDFAKMVMDHEAIMSIYRLLGGIDFSDEELVLDLQKEKGPGASYLTAKHTFANCRKFVQSDLFDRENYGIWKSKNQDKSFTDLAYAKAKHIIETHQPDELPQGVDKQMMEIITDLEKKIAANS